MQNSLYDGIIFSCAGTLGQAQQVHFLMQKTHGRIGVLWFLGKAWRHSSELLVLGFRVALYFLGHLFGAMLDARRTRGEVMKPFLSVRLHDVYW